jgi:peptide/nickel transport system substrate-binding protein
MNTMQTIRRWLLISFIGLALAACTGTSTTMETPQSSIVYGLTLQPSGFDPHINASSELGIPLRSVYDTLVYRDPATHAFLPWLASEWTISDDGLEYTFTLRQDVHFHDNTPFNAQAVAANLDRITSPDTASQKAVFLLGSYDSYEIMDDYTILLRLSEPYAPLLDSLSQVYLGIASPSALAQYANDVYQFHQVGSGPYQFVDYLPGDHITLRRNPDYQWMPARYQSAPENAPDEITFRFYEDPPSRVLALEGGNVDIIGELLPTDARNLGGNSQVGVLPVAIPGQPLQFLMNTQRYPTDDERFRMALLYATNREAIIDSVYQRFSPVAWGPLAAATTFYAPEVTGRYAYDLSQAQSLLQSMGLSDSDNNGYLDFGGADIEVTLIVPTWGLIPQVAQLIQDQWRDIGIRAVLDQVPSRGALLERLEAGNFNLAATYEFGLDPAFLSRYYGSDGVNNYTGYGDPILDSLLFDAQRQTDANARHSLYSQAQTLIMDHALVLPIRDYVNLNGYQAEIQGLAFDAYGWFPLLLNLQVPGS